MSSTSNKQKEQAMETKAWYESKTIWGSIISVGALVAGFFGIKDEVDPETQAKLVDNIVVIAGAVGSVIGTVLSIYGRIKANATIAPKQ
jgi:hypothetical protein